MLDFIIDCETVPVGGGAEARPAMRRQGIDTAGGSSRRKFLQIGLDGGPMERGMPRAFTKLYSLRYKRVWEAH